MRIAIVDDDERFAGKVERAILQEKADKHYDFEIQRFQNAIAFLCQLDERQMADVYFLDIEIGEQNGLDLAKRIRMADENAFIIFLTSHEKYAIEGYTYHAYSYLMKDKWKEKLPEVLRQVWDSARKREGRVYRIQSERKYFTIYLDDICYIEKDVKNTVFYCKGNHFYRERCAISEVYKRLPEREFIFINRSQIVNIKYITHVDAGSVEVNSEITLNISRNLLGDIRKRLVGYWRK